jgi:ankyrin repeat protein
MQWARRLVCTLMTALPLFAAASETPPSVDPSFPLTHWLSELFPKRSASASEQARARLNALGAKLDGPGLVLAVAVEDGPLVELFLQAGADLNTRDEQGRTALLLAVLTENWTLLDDLLKRGADPNLADLHGLTPLMAAASVSQLTALSALADHGANLDLTDERRHTALHYALDQESDGALRLLLDHGARPSGPCCEGHDLLTHAIETGYWTKIELVLSHEPPTLTWNPTSRRALLAAIEDRNEKRTRLFLSKHPAPPTPEGRAQPLLAYAVRDGDLAAFRLLLRCGADPNAPLGSPTERSFSEPVTHTFLRHSLEEDRGMTILMLAAGFGRLEFVRELLAKGAHRNVCTEKEKNPALIFAAHADSPETMQLLMGDCPSPDKMRVEISLGDQRVTVLRDGAPILQSEVSTGKSGYETPAGRYVITDKEPVHRSTIYKVPMPFFMRLNCNDFRMHEGVVPGYPASHGCIRLPAEAARKLYKELPVGTLVEIDR